MKKYVKYLKKIAIASAVPCILMGTLYAESVTKPNRYLAAPIYGVTHFDPSQSDSFPYEVKTGEFSIDLKNYPQVTGGPINIITLASTSPNYMWGVSSQGVTYIDVMNGNFKEVTRLDVLDMPGQGIVSQKMHEEVLRKDYSAVEEVEKSVKEVYDISSGRVRLSNGVYSAVDKDNVVYANFNAYYVYALTLVDKDNPEKGIKILRKLDTRTFLNSDEHITGLNMTYDGKIIIVGTHSLTVVDREFKKDPVLLEFGSDEYITNSIAVDQKNGIYVASDKYMRKVVWTGKKLSIDEKDGAWSTLYEIGQQPPAIKIGKGTGSTPTLMGFGDDEDKLVVITDGANRMNIVAFWRDEIPVDFKQKAGTKSNRIADQMPITAGLPKDGKWVQSEQSVVVKGYGAFVINNIVDKSSEDNLAGVIALGPVLTPPVGAERVEWDAVNNKWKSIWTRADVSSISMVPAVSRASNIVFVNGYYKNSGWEVTGLDWNTGKTVYRAKFGFDNFGNGAYAILQFFPNGDLLFNSIAGPFRINHGREEYKSDFKNGKW